MKPSSLSMFVRLALMTVAFFLLPLQRKQLIYGLDPATCIFDQEKMRRHLYECFVRRKLTPFPRKGACSTSAVKSLEEIDIHCYCRLPELKGVAMIECSMCSNWFHFFCANIIKEPGAFVLWFCSKCIK